MRRLRHGYRWLRQYWIEVTTVLLALVVLLFGGVRFIAESPDGQSIIYPAKTFYWEAGVIVFAPVYVVLVIGFLLVIPFFVSTFVSRIDTRTGIRVDPPKMKQLLVMISVASLAYAVLEDTVGHPNTLDALRTEDHRYYLLWDVRDLDEDQFFVYECDSSGWMCDLLTLAEAGRNSLWDEDAQLRVEDESVVVFNRGRAIFDVSDTTTE